MSCEDSETGSGMVSPSGIILRQHHGLQTLARNSEYSRWEYERPNKTLRQI